MSYLISVLDRTSSACEQPTVTIDGAVVRFQKREFFGEDTNEYERVLNGTTFGIAYNQLSRVRAESLRQKRPTGADPHFSLRIVLKGEHVEGEGGPYRQFFTDIAEELKCGRVPLLAPVPNAAMQGTANRDSHIPAPKRNSVQDLEFFRFLGLLMGMAIRTSVLIPLELACCFWKRLVFQPVKPEDIQEIDDSFLPSLDAILESSEDQWEGDARIFFLKFTCNLSDGSRVVLKPGGENEDVSYETRSEYVRLVKEARVKEIETQTDAIRAGMSAVVPSAIWNLFTWQELEWRVCGKPFIDVALLKRHTDYDKAVDPEAPHIKWFWEVLEAMSQRDLRKFIRFAWAQELLPADDAEFIRTRTTMKIKPFPSSARNQDNCFLKVDTCFFNVMIPEYSSKEILESKLMVAIHEVSSMDADELHGAVEFADDESDRGYSRHGSDSDRDY